MIEEKSFAYFRRGLDDLFSKSDIRSCKERSHTPFLIVNFDEKKIELCDSPIKLINDYSDDTDVIVQWRGQWRSDFFYFKIGELIDYIAKNPKESYQHI